MAKSRSAGRGKTSSEVVLMRVICVALLVITIVLGFHARSSSRQAQEANKNVGDLNTLLGRRYAVQFRNMSTDRLIGVSATVANLATGEARPVSLEIPPQNTREIGAGDKWYVNSAQINIMKKVKAQAAAN